MILSPNEIAHVAMTQWKGTDDQTTAVAVALAESGGDTDALGRVKPTTAQPGSGNTDHGLWQVSNLWNGALLAGPAGSVLNWRDPWTNAMLAFAVWSAQGWNGWSVYKSGAYRLWLPTAKVALAHPFMPPTTQPQPIVLNGSIHLEQA